MILTHASCRSGQNSTGNDGRRNVWQKQQARSRPVPPPRESSSDSWKHGRQGAKEEDFGQSGHRAGETSYSAQRKTWGATPPAEKTASEIPQQRGKQTDRAISAAGTPTRGVAGQEGKRPPASSDAVAQGQNQTAVADHHPQQSQARQPHPAYGGGMRGRGRGHPMAHQVNPRVSQDQVYQMGYAPQMITNAALLEQRSLSAQAMAELQMQQQQLQLQQLLHQQMLMYPSQAAPMMLGMNAGSVYSQGSRQVGEASMGQQVLQAPDGSLFVPHPQMMMMPGQSVMDTQGYEMAGQAWFGQSGDMIPVTSAAMNMGDFSNQPQRYQVAAPVGGVPNAMAGATPGEWQSKRGPRGPTGGHAHVGQGAVNGVKGANQPLNSAAAEWTGQTRQVNPQRDSRPYKKG